MTGKERIAASSGLASRPRIPRRFGGTVTNLDTKPKQNTQKADHRSEPDGVAPAVKLADPGGQNWGEHAAGVASRVEERGGTPSTATPELNGRHPERALGCADRAQSQRKPGHDPGGI